MPDPSIQPPYLVPSAYPDYLDMQRKQMLASMLMQNTQQSSQTPADWNQMKLVPRRSPLSNLSTLASGLLAGKAYGSAQQAQQKYFQGTYNPQQPQQGANPQQGAPPQGAPSQSPQGAQNPLIPSGMSQGTAQQVLGMMGPEKYAESMIAPNFKPAEIQAQLRAAGMDPNSPQGHAIALRAIQKAQYTPPIEQRPGAIERDPYTNEVIGQNPSLPQGAANIYDAQGRLAGSGMVPGAAEAIAQSTGASTAGKVANEYTTLPTAGGGSTVVGGPHTGLPPTQQKSYFPTPTTLPGPPQTPATPPVDPNSPWANVPKLPISSAIGAPNDFTKNVLKGAADKHQELVTKYGNEADIADQKMNYNNEALKALPNAEVGPLSHFFTENRAKMQEWGVSPKLIPGSGSVTPTFELNKNLLNSALNGAKQIYGARMTGNEVMLQKNEASPSVATSQAAIKSLISQDNARNAYFKQRSQDYGQYMNQGGDPNRFESWYSSKFPLQQFAQKYSFSQNPNSAKALATLKASPALAPAFKQKYGFLPDAGP